MNITKTIIITVALALVSACYSHAREVAESDSLTRELQEVVVSARQPATRLVGTTLVSTIAGSNLQNAGTALDVLGQLPLIHVDDSEVSVTGRSDIEIQIDGRRIRDSYELEQLQSVNIRKVELLMSPGALYATTTGAVIKITTRHTLVDGLSVTDRLQVRCRRRWSVMDYIDMNYRMGRWDCFIDGSYNHDNTLIKGYTSNSLMYDGQEAFVGSSQRNRFSVDAATVRAGFNYADDTHSFGAYYRFNPEHAHFTNDGNEWLDDIAPLERVIGRDTDGRSHQVSAYYDGLLAGKSRLHFDGDFRHSSADNAVCTEYPSSYNPAVNSTDRRVSTLWAGKLYAEIPVAKGDLTVGTQDSYTHTTLDYRMLTETVGSYIPSSLTDARQLSSALFASWHRSWKRIDLTVGARYEYVDYRFESDGVKDEAASRCDHLLTPDVTIGCSFSEDSQLSLSYKMSTVRPPYSQLTGSLIYVGMHEIEGGNPRLRDEKMHTLRLSGMWRGFMLQTDFTRSADTYAYVKQLYPAPTLQLLMHPVNVDVTALSAYLVWNRIIRFWTPEVTAGFYTQWMDIDGTSYDAPIFSYDFGNTFAFGNGWTATANISGQSAGDMHTNHFGSSWFSMDASIGKSFINKSLNIRLAATDIFNTASNDWSMHTYGIHVSKHQSYDRRGISLNVTYRFHPRKSKYKGEAAFDAELHRL